MWLTRLSVNNPVTAVMMMAALLVTGLFALGRMPVDQFPELDFPVVVLTTDYPGASPEVVETEVTRPLEEVINTLSGLKTLSSRSFQGQSLVIAEFDLLTQSSQALQDIREKVALVQPLFRDEVGEPVITRFNPDDFPVASILVEPADNSLDLRRLSLLTRQVIKKRLENINGIGAVNLLGATERQLLIEPDLEAMEALAISPTELTAAIVRDNQILPLGRLKDSSVEASVQLDSRLKSARDFEQIVVRNSAGRVILLGELANIADADRELESIALFNGKRVIALDILKAQDANAIAVTEAVRKSLPDIEKELGGQVKLSLARDLSVPIKNSLADVRATLIEGALLTILIVFLFLGSWRSTVITGLTLPIALIGTFSVLYALGFTINLLTLLAMSICIGLLIDDAIVVRENIVRHLGMGKDHHTASLEGTREIGLAVLATTFSIVAVFLPVGFMGGIIGQFFHQFGITVACAVLLSMFVSFTLDPMLSAVWYDPQAHGQKVRGPMGRLLDTFQNLMVALEQRYVDLLRWGLEKPKTVIALALASFVASFLLLGKVGVEFTPPVDNSELNIQFETPQGSTLLLTERKVSQVESLVRQHPEVDYVYTGINTGFLAGENQANLYIKLVPRKERNRSVDEISSVLRKELKQIAGIKVTQVGPEQSVSSGKPIQVSIQGPELTVLQQLSDQIYPLMSADPRLADLNTSLKPTRPTVELQLSRESLADRGLSLSSIERAIRPLMAGETVGSWLAPNEETYRIVLQLPELKRENLEQLARIPVFSGNNTASTDPELASIPLGELVQFKQATAPAQINRKALNREILLTANVEGAAAGSVSSDLQNAIALINMPAGYRVEYGGSSKDIEDTLGFAFQALLLAIVFIYLILASQFASFVQPLVIMMSLPLSLIGVILSLLLFGSTLNIFSIIGFVMLMGLVTKNAILLVDFANQAMRAGTEVKQALLQAAETRLRPILMTTLAMVFGMLPLALAQGEGSEQRSPMAHAVIGGILTSTLLTLLVVPVLIYLIERRRTAKKLSIKDQETP